MLALLLAIRVVLALPASGSDYEPRFPPLPSPALLHALLPSGRDTVFWIWQVLEVLLQPRAQDSIATPTLRRTQLILAPRRTLVLISSIRQQ